MKKGYMKPETNIVICKMERSLLTGSDVAVGNEYGGTQVLSRESKSSFWDEDEDE